MATAAYYRWRDAGSPWRLAQPIAELAELVQAHPHLALVGTIGDQGHLTDATPEDHTPFSIDEWPDEVGEYVVCAIDFKGPPELLAKIAAKFLREKPGWLKYFIWRGSIGKTGLRDVRHNWRYQESSGHTWYIHASIRTDWIDRSIGDYQLTGDDEMWFDEKHEVPRHWLEQFPDDAGVADGTVWGKTTQISGYFHSRHARQVILTRVVPLLETIAAEKMGCSLDDLRAELVQAAERERAERRAELEPLHELLRAHSSGTLDAEDVVRRIGALLSGAAPPPEG